MIQSAIIVILFAAALFYLGRMIYRQFTARSGCASGCGKCGVIDFKKIEAKVRRDTASVR